MERWPALLSRKDAAAYLGISPSEFSLVKAEGRIKSVQFRSNGQPRYKRSDLDELIESLEYGDGRCSATNGVQRCN